MFVRVMLCPLQLLGRAFLVFSFPFSPLFLVPARARSLPIRSARGRTGRIRPGAACTDPAPGQGQTAPQAAGKNRDLAWQKVSSLPRAPTWWLLDPPLRLPSRRFPVPTEQSFPLTRDPGGRPNGIIKRKRGLSAREGLPRYLTRNLSSPVRAARPPSPTRRGVLGGAPPAPEVIWEPVSRAARPRLHVQSQIPPNLVPKLSESAAPSRERVT